MACRAAKVAGGVAALMAATLPPQCFAAAADPARDGSAGEQAASPVGEVVPETAGTAPEVAPGASLVAAEAGVVTAEAALAGANMTAMGATAADAGARCSSAEIPLASKCTGCPPKFNGKLCASTTFYEDHTLGSCGCGRRGPFVEDDYWTLTSYTAALNTKNLDPMQPELTWCLSGCGQCYELCTTGGATNTMDKASPAGECQVFKITNRCADGWTEDRPDWCSQTLSWQECVANPGRCRQRRGTNMFGYSAHFDLQDAHRQVQHGLGWDNVEVTFQPVSCDRWDGPQDVECSQCRR